MFSRRDKCDLVFDWLIVYQGYRDKWHEHYTREVTRQNNLKGKVTGTKFWFPRLDFFTKMDNSHEGTKSPGIVAGTSLLVRVPTFDVGTYYATGVMEQSRESLREIRRLAFTVKET